MWFPPKDNGIGSVLINKIEHIRETERGEIESLFSSQAAALAFPSPHLLCTHSKVSAGLLGGRRSKKRICEKQKRVDCPRVKSGTEGKMRRRVGIY